MFQTEAPKSGDLVATMKTSMGDIRIRLFPQYAPKAVENFVTHAKNGYYNGTVFHRVIEDFMIQGGDPTASGMGGESIWGESFADEFDPQLHNLRGALSMANAGPGTNGSQFFIVQAKTVSDDMLDQLESASEQLFPTECVRAYETLGGTPWLDYKHTVFGQVIEGMETVDAIAAVKVDFFANKPLQDVVLESVTVETVVMLSHKKPDSVINVKVEFGEGEGKAPLDNIAKRAAAYKPKERVTYKMIQEYIEKKYGFKVHTAYIAEVKRDLGLPMYDAPNAVEELKQARKHPTVEKVEAIKEALKHFEVI